MGCLLTDVVFSLFIRNLLLMNTNNIIIMKTKKRFADAL